MSISHRLTGRLLSSAGRSFEPDERLPPRDVVGELARRATQLLRGVIRFRSAAFVGSRCRVYGKDRLHLWHGSQVGEECLLDARGTEGLHLSNGAKLGRRGVVTTTSHLSRYGIGLQLGPGSGIADYFHIGASGGVRIGRNVIAGPFLTVHSQEHVFEDPSTPIKHQGTREATVVVGDDCWLGSRVTLLAGATLGDRTVVASGAVVRGEHPGGVVLAGVPARVVRLI